MIRTIRQRELELRRKQLIKNVVHKSQNRVAIILKRATSVVDVNYDEFVSAAKNTQFVQINQNVNFSGKTVRCALVDRAKWDELEA